MNAKRGIIVLGLLSAASMPTWAQQIKGVVIDQKSKETLIGAREFNKQVQNYEMFL